ncbi:MAG: phosphoribosylamine--glycine ligase [Burkholderiales bacterium]|nr:phosphoribosylamine--glycine ligase [Burkholderiales bacterium]
MRFLGVGDTCDLAWMYRGLAGRGHEVRVFVHDDACHDVHAGWLQRTDDWMGELGWLREAGEDGIALFETATHGPVQDALRAEGFQVIGGSGVGDRLEADREYGQHVLAEAGLRVAASRRFTHWHDAHDFIGREPGRYVLKFNDAAVARTRNYIGQRADGADMAALLATYEDHVPEGECCDFVLMDHLDGVEVGVGGYFNGREFMTPVCVDFEHKRLFPGDLGELTGEMGTLVTYRGGRTLFERVLAPVAPLLAASGYCGYINVNLIANEDGLWPLEFTSRFGYPGFAICEALHTTTWEDIFRRMLRRERLDFGTRGGWAAGVVLTVPPFPYRQGYAELSKGMRVQVDATLTAGESSRLAWAEVALAGSDMVTAGASGYLGVATGLAPEVIEARDAALALARRVWVPNLRYRNDIGQRLADGDLERLRTLRLFDTAEVQVTST